MALVVIIHFVFMFFFFVVLFVAVLYDVIVDSIVCVCVYSYKSTTVGRTINERGGYNRHRLTTTFGGVFGHGFPLKVTGQKVREPTRGLQVTEFGTHTHVGDGGHATGVRRTALRTFKTLDIRHTIPLAYSCGIWYQSSRDN